MNNKPKELTPDILRNYKGCEHYTDDEAENIIMSFKKFAELTYRCYKEDRELGLIDKNTNKN